MEGKFSVMFGVEIFFLTATSMFKFLYIWIGTFPQSEWKSSDAFWDVALLEVEMWRVGDLKSRQKEDGTRPALPCKEISIRSTRKKKIYIFFFLRSCISSPLTAAAASMCAFKNTWSRILSAFSCHTQHESAEHAEPQQGPGAALSTGKLLQFTSGSRLLLLMLQLLESHKANENWALKNSRKNDGK